MFRCGVFRVVEACSDSPSPALASGKGVSFRFAFAGFWLRRADPSKALRCRLGTQYEISVDDEALQRGDNFQGKKAMVLGSSV
ncbi:hypothetical protein F2Q69_00031911 [Brassica cretica]|uniref:Uncharacterized protein n=1 Tax=Brassica cretica TaxID=69181 RepID=A0A8S9S7L4_BRACR|nr:hypothetical protein F2Q69_00031911 [Brassica cretica]